jgi:hydroxymethylpyrimidine pyrophosphatase-like HAD family hydrolase
VIFASAATEVEARFIKRYEELTGTKQIIVPDVKSGEDFVEKVEAMEKESGFNFVACKMLIFSETYKIDETYNAFAANAGDGDDSTLFNLVRGSPPPFFIELLPPKISKGAGLLSLVKTLEIEASDVLAFGDGDNDLEFVREAGHGCAMLNATERTNGMR